MSDSSSVDLGIPGITDAVPFGSGGSAVVYRARQEALDREVAVKVIRGSHLSPSAQRQFDRERRTMGRLSAHPGIVPIYDTGFTATGEAYLIMPFLERGSLQDELQGGGPFLVEQAVADMLTVSRAVQHAHENAILHRDIKPGNIMRSATGEPLVTDFGIARLMENEPSTMSLALTLTPAYSAPEVFDGGEATVGTDVYSLGATLYALIEGEPAFAGEDGVFALMRRIATEPVPDLRHLAPDGVCAAIEAAMAKDPSARPGSAETFAAMLERGMTTTTVEPATTAPPAAPAGDVVIAPLPTQPAAPVAAPPPPPAPPPPSRSPEPTAVVASQAPPPAPPPTTAPSQPSSAEPPTPPPGKRKSRAPLIVGGLIVAGLVAAAVVVGPSLLDDGDNGPSASPTATTDATPTTETATPTESTEPTATAELDPTAIAERNGDAVVLVEAAGCRTALLATGYRPAPELAITSGPIGRAWRVRLRDTGGGWNGAFADAPSQPLTQVANPLGPAPTADLAGDDRVTTGNRVALLGMLDVTSPTPTVAVGEVVRAEGAAIELQFDQELPPQAIGSPVFVDEASLAGIVYDVNGTTAVASRVGPAAWDPIEVLCAMVPEMRPPADWNGALDPTIKSVLLAQQLATALADGDWELVRRLEPGKADFDDARFEEGWGTLDVSTLVPVRLNDRGDVHEWRFGLVAHETVDGVEVTKPFCVTWEVDLANGTVAQTGRNSELLFDPDNPFPGWRDPVELVPTVAGC